MQIPPQYKITSKIIDLLAKIDANRILLSSQKIPEKLKEKIQRISLLHSSLFSARIEGNPLTVENVENAKDQKKKAEVINLIQAAGFIDKKINKSDKISQEIILKLHEMVMKDVGDGGFLRKEPSAIFNSSGIAVYMTPPPSEINNLLSQILDYANSGKENFPLIVSLITHLVFEKIHPFIDGNGRVGRLLIFAVLASKDYDFGLTIPFEKYLDEHKEEYYYHLDNGLRETEDYLKFMLSAIFEESKNLLARIEEEKSKEEDLYLLPPRQEEIVRIIRDHVFVSLDLLQRRFAKVPGRTLRYDLNKLQQKGLIVKTGRTRGSLYKAAQS